MDVEGEKNMNQEQIGKFIATCRKNKKVTQQELAEKLGVTDRAISNWENGKNMPDLSLFKPLCDELNITINDLISGEKVSGEEYQEKLEENIMHTLEYTNKKIKKNTTFIGILFLLFGVLISITAISIFPSESSWGSIYSVFGAIVSLIGVSIFTRIFSYLKRLIFNLGYFILFVSLLMLIDLFGVINIHQAPRFAHTKISGESVIYYDTIFYDVVRCNVNQENETFKILKNQKYDRDTIDIFCK